MGILNPAVELSKFFYHDYPAKEEECLHQTAPQLSFSSDVVVLEITGPDVIDLTLIDLPGIISNAGPKGDENDVILIEEMVKGYLKQDTLILLVITMTGVFHQLSSTTIYTDSSDDIQNQKAARFAREADPEGKRTIGVLTKVDMLVGVEDKTRWLDVLRNADKVLAHGYFVSTYCDLPS